MILKDYRPGIEAAKKAGVISPLAKFKFSKKDIRDISRALGFPWWDKPAQPCLSSRFPYGHEITSERLKMVEKAEEYLKKRWNIRSQSKMSRFNCKNRNSPR